MTALAAFIAIKYIIKMVLLSICLWLVEAGLAVYHVGVEQHWWTSATGCSASGATGQSLEALRAQIMGAALVSCDQPELIVLGLSMAGWNIVYSLAMVFILTYVVFRKGK